MCQRQSLCHLWMFHKVLPLTGPNKTFSVLLEAPEKFSRIMLQLGSYHIRDVHQWPGGECEFDEQSLCSCGRCEDSVGCERKPYQTKFVFHRHNIQIRTMNFKHKKLRKYAKRHNFLGKLIRPDNRVGSLLLDSRMVHSMLPLTKKKESEDSSAPTTRPVTCVISFVCMSPSL